MSGLTDTYLRVYSHNENIAPNTLGNETLALLNDELVAE